LDIQPHHLVWDSCASPGSKTTQLLEVVASLDSGGVIANELDPGRASMLSHRIQAVKSASVLISNHDAKRFPRLKVGFTPKTYHGGKLMEFDRVLCDVPCSGDGTLRKAPDLWRRWSPNMSRGNHATQIAIAQRGLRLLKVGGRLVYSTCSMHPTENEAVVLALLRWAEGAARLVDCSDMLPLLKRRPGLLTWKQMSTHGEWIDSSTTQDTYPTMFAPADQDETRRHNLQWCWRIMPHDQDTGGFFVAVFEKTAFVPGEEAEKHRYALDDAKELKKRENISGDIPSDDRQEEIVVDDVEVDANDEDDDADAVEKKRVQPPATSADVDAGADMPTKKQKKDKEFIRRSGEPPWIQITSSHPFMERLKFGLDFFGLNLDPEKFCVRTSETFR
jgi:16S rRNA C967 or C1407 C5-methylase (RsmB/RsmF family)